jgi:RNA polymerase sigma-70 factor (ECF subfamily)
MSTRSTPALPELLAHTRWIEDLARSLVRDPNAAEDLAQSTILIALERTDAAPANLRAWLARVLRNKARETGRRESGRNAIERLGARTEALPSADEVIERAERERGVVAAVLALEEPHRGTLLLRYFEGLSPEEIARRSHVPLATVTSRITRAHARLRESLSKDGRSVDWIAAIAPILQRSSGTPAATAASLTGVIVMSTALKVLAALVLVALAVWWALPGKAPNASAPLVEPSTHSASAADSRSPDEPDLASASKRTPSTAAPVEKPAPEAVAPAAPVAPPAAVTGGRIFGRVIRPDGEPATQRKVRLMRMGDSRDKYVPTDATGSFDERNLAPGTWSLATWPDEKELALLGKTSAETLNGMSYLAQLSVELTAGAEHEVVLGKPPENGVHVRGRVLDGDKPCEGLLSWLPDGRNAMDLMKPVKLSETNGFDVLLDNPGRYVISANCSDTNAEFVFDVPAVKELEHDFVLPSGTIAGRVTARDGTPVRDARVDLVPRAAQNPRNPVADIQFSHRTDAEGKFRFRCLPRARFELGVHSGTIGPKEDGRLAAATAVREIDLVTTDQRDDILVTVGTGVKVKGTVSSATGGVNGGCVFLFSAEGEPLNPLDSTFVKSSRFETFPLEPGTWFAIVAIGFEWSPSTRFVVPPQGEPDEIELHVAPVAKLTIEIEGTDPTWIDVRDANNCSLSSLLDKHVYNREICRDWSPGSYLYRLPAGNYDLAAIGAKERRTGRVSLMPGQQLTTKLAER